MEKENYLVVSKFYRDVPENLKKLLVKIINGFYEYTHKLILNVLLRYICVSELDMTELLKLDKKETRKALSILQSDRIIKCKIRMETNPETASSTKHTYYYINFGSIRNIIRYKLEMIRKSIESKNVNNTQLVTFICPECTSKYTDLQVNLLMDMETNTLRCTYCGEEVVENDNQERQHSRNLMVSFNEQLKDIFEIMHTNQSFDLKEYLIDPDPCPLTFLQDRHAVKTEEKHRGEKTSIKVNIKDTTIDSNAVKKTQPVWISQSTVLGTQDNSEFVQDSKTETLDENDSIMASLVNHEKTDKEDVPIDDPFLESKNEFENTLQNYKINVQGKAYQYEDITDELVCKMSADEKNIYIKAGQLLYSDYYV
ncbi:General transcription factor IIE subunit [Intoshia linei]|uniref:General transcription factor IIE subunit n=1 Tax=Intoshia linei TaxID=1819745 RepID=A0A177BA57_9BILA|nr:General transcription factor IIE subunit [Intoshia linei]